MQSWAQIGIVWNISNITPKEVLKCSFCVGKSLATCDYHFHAVMALVHARNPGSQ